MQAFEHVVPLLKVELKRQRAMLLRMAGLTVLVIALFFVAGKRTPVDQMAVLLGASFGVILIVPMGISRDKMEGTLEFLCGLPVEPDAITASRFIALALMTLPWAVGAGLMSLALPAIIALNPFAVALLAWLVMMFISTCGTALLARFDLQTVAGAPLAAMMIFLFLFPRFAHAFMPGLTGRNLVAFMQRPYGPMAIALALAAVLAAVGAAAFSVTSRAIATYRRDTTVR